MEGLGLLMLVILMTSTLYKIDSFRMLMTETKLIELIKQGLRPYCLLNVNQRNYSYEEDSPCGYMAGGFVDGYLEIGHPENPFKFPVFYTEPRTQNSWHGRTFYRTALAVTRDREKALTEQQLYFAGG